MINTVKIQGNGYLIDSCIYVPKDTSNRDYQEILEWIGSGNVIEPEFTEEEIVAKALQIKLSEAQAYLDGTDWVDPYLIRHELGIDILSADSNKLVIASNRVKAKIVLQELK